MAPIPDPAERLRQAMAALGEPQRFRLARLLAERARAVGELVEATGMPQPLVSHHLSVLSRAGLAEFERSGRHAYYRLSCSDHQELRVLVDLMQISGSGGLDRDACRPDPGEAVSMPAPRPGEIEDYLL